MALTPRLSVGDNLLGWGKLIKSWATGLDYVNQPLTAQPPRTAWVNATLDPPAGTTPGPADVASAGQQWELPPTMAVDVAGPGGLVRTLPRAVAMTTEEFYGRLAAAGVTAQVKPAQYTHVIVVQGDRETMVIRLPPKDTLQGSEDDLIAGEPYPIERFYSALYGGTSAIVPRMPPPGAAPAAVANARAAIMELHANRIGEYTLNNCN